MRPQSLTALVLSMIGAALDFVSGSQIATLQQMNSSSDGMGGSIGVQTTATSWYWVTGLYGLGAIVALTGILAITSVAMKRMKTFGGLMVAYGSIMIVTGLLMYSGMMVGSAALSGLGMFVVGSMMTVNGYVMFFRGR